MQDLTEKGLIDLTIEGDDRIFHVKKALAESARPIKNQMGHDIRSGYGMLDAVAWRDAVEASAYNW